MFDKELLTVSPHLSLLSELYPGASVCLQHYSTIVSSLLLRHVFAWMAVSLCPPHVGTKCSRIQARFMNPRKQLLLKVCLWDFGLLLFGWEIANKYHFSSILGALGMADVSLFRIVK